MKTERGCRRIRLAFHPGFCRPVKIRVEAEPLHSADRIVPLVPAGSLVRNLRPPSTLPVRWSRLRHPQSEPQSDWRIVGDHDLLLQEESEGLNP
jgi:hypothetical protein